MSRNGATSSQIEAARDALAEVAEILEDYPHVVIIGGNVPYLAIPQDEDPHEGTVDIDMVFARPLPRNDQELTFYDVLMRKNFVQDTRHPFRFFKAYGSEKVVIDLLTGGTTPASGRVEIPSEDLHVSVIEGVEVALIQPDLAKVPGTAKTVQIANIAAFLAMKSIALHQREESKKQKDSYDIVYCLRNYPGGIDAIAKVYREVGDSPLIQAGVDRLTSLFSNLESVGPTSYATRSSLLDEYKRLQREAYERVQDLLKKLGDSG